MKLTVTRVEKSFETFPIPNVGNVIIWQDDGDVMLRLPPLTVAGKSVAGAVSGDEYVFVSLVSNEVFVLPRDRVIESAAPAHAVAVENGLISFAED